MVVEELGWQKQRGGGSGRVGVIGRRWSLCVGRSGMVVEVVGCLWLIWVEAVF